MIDNINDNQENNLWEENAYIEQKKKSLSKEQEPVCDTTTETKKNVIENECKDTGKEKRVCGCCEKDFLTTSKTKKFCSRSCAASYGNRNFHKSDEHFKNKQKEYRENRKKTKKIILNCENCNTDFQRTEQQYRHINLHYNKKCFCSRRCASDFARKNGLVKYRSRMPTVELQCLWCSKIFYRKLRKIRKHRKIFCSTSCSSKYNTKYRSYARSSLELYVENQLKTLYPTLNIKYNSRFELDSGLELDIFIPSLKLAFEINGKYTKKKNFR